MLTKQQIAKNREEYLDLLKSQCGSTKGMDALMDYLDHETDFFEAPASTRFHGSFEGGLCQHSLNVYHRLLENGLTEGYSLGTITLVSLLHDICKANIYQKSVRNVKENGVWKQVPCYTVKDSFPFGHGEKSVVLILRYVALSEEEMLAINWHMGGFDQRVNGGNYALSDAFNSSRLALELHLADMRASYVDEKD